MTVTRTFTDVEEEVLTRCLIACRPTVSDEDRAVIDGMIRDGWERFTPVHKAEPEDDGSLWCKHCNESIQRVPGGHGPTWVHINSGAVAGSGAPS